MKPTKQTAYLPVKEDYGIYLSNFLGYPEGYSYEGNLQNQEGYFLTAEQLNEYTASVIKQALETAAEKAETKTEEVYAGSLGNEEGKLYNKIGIIDKTSITNTFDETYKKFEV